MLLYVSTMINNTKDKTFFALLRIEFISSHAEVAFTSFQLTIFSQAGFGRTHDCISYYSCKDNNFFPEYAMTINAAICSCSLPTQSQTDNDDDKRKEFDDVQLTRAKST